MSGPWARIREILAIGTGPADPDANPPRDSDLSQHVALPAVPAPAVPDPAAARGYEAMAAELAAARAAAGAAAADARQWKAHANQAGYLAEQERASAQHWQDLAHHRARQRDAAAAELGRFQRMHGRSSARIGELRGQLALAREAIREAHHQHAATVVHKPWPYCAGDDDPLCQCGSPVPADARRTVDAQDLAARLAHVRETLVQQAVDWELTAASLGSIAEDSTDDSANAAAAAQSAFGSCATRIRGIADAIPGHPVSGPDAPAASAEVAPIEVDGPGGHVHRRAVPAIPAAGPDPDPDGVVDAEVVDRPGQAELDALRALDEAGAEGAPAETIARLTREVAEARAAGDRVDAESGAR